MIGLKSDYTSWLFQVLFNLKIQHFLADAMNSSSESPAATAHVQHVSKQVVLSRILAVVFVFYEVVRDCVGPLLNTDKNTYLVTTIR